MRPTLVVHKEFRQVSALGAFTFVLHSHLPYARMAGRWPHGEEWIHEAATETYIPLLQALYDLKEEGVKYKVTIGITPILAEQLSDADVLRNLALYIDDKIVRARKDLDRFTGARSRFDDDDAEDDDLYDDEFEDDDELDEDDEEFDENDEDLYEDDDELDEEDDDLFARKKPTLQPEWWVGNPQMIELAKFYLRFFEGTKRALHDRFKGDIVGAFRHLQDEGYIEITTSAATHGYLPLLGSDAAIFGQLKTGVESYRRHFGRDPRGIWLPECAYRPAYYDENGKVRPGIERYLSELGLKVFFSETHLITGGQPVGVAAGDAIGPYGAIKRRYLVPMSTVKPESDGGTTFQAYYVADTTAAGRTNEHSGVAVIGRNNRLGMQVWSAEWGYPGDFDYREFHRKDPVSGFQYWRVTGPKIDLGHKDLYHPDWAEYKVRSHADHFSNLVQAELEAYHDGTGQFGLIACNYDTELFGHWWFEGVDWIKEVLRRLAANPNVQLTTASEFVEQHPPKQVMNLPEGSWGAGGTHFTWDNEDTHWMWEPIYDAERRMEKLVAKHGKNADESVRGVLNQTARELLLLESSDWPFLVTTGQAREYAIQRFAQHVERFTDLAKSVERGQPDGELAARLWELDRVFPGVDFTCWRRR
jgi:1,4-alpha-glucan branching enzyme